MEHLIDGILIVVGLINLAPAAGVVSRRRLEQMYGVEIVGADLTLFMRHRASLFGLLGGLIIAAAFVPALEPWAVIAGLFSMLGYVALSLAESGHGAIVRRLVIIDVAASVALAVVPILRLTA